MDPGTSSSPRRLRPRPAPVVALVGAGPGDPGLLTLTGADRLRRAEVVLYDALVHPDVLEHAGSQAELIYVGKRSGSPCLRQEAVNDLLVLRARRGERVVRLKGGDPFVFGRGGEEAEALARAGVPFEIVPGVTSAVAAPAYAGIPVTDRRFTSAVTFATGHLPPDDPASSVDWGNLAVAGGTLVILMGVRNAGRIAAALMDAGRVSSTPVAIVESATYDHQRTTTTTLADLGPAVQREGVSSPAVLVIGEVVGLRSVLAWCGGIAVSDEAPALQVS